jgi:hypothetical protein
MVSSSFGAATSGFGLRCCDVADLRQFADDVIASAGHMAVIAASFAIV